MESKTSNFQIIILIVFGFFIIVGVILFSTSKLKSNNAVVITPVVMWGTLDLSTVNKFISDINEKNKGALQITYIEKNPKSFEKDLVEAIADGAGPDMIILPQDIIVKNINKFAVLPYSVYPLRDYKDRYIDVSSIYLKSDGIIALPFIVDPMVMYWNKTHFANVSITNAPKDWNEFSNVVAKLTKKDSNFNIIQSGAALGEYQNILHAKDILSMLFIQAGVPIVVKNEKDEYSSALLVVSNQSEKLPAILALSFYTDFANPTKESYSWNRSLKSSFDSFIAGDTSIYFGYASELPSISLKNPNLNFDVAKIPQVTNTKKKSIFAKMYGLAVLKSSKNQNSAMNQALTMTSKESISNLSTLTNLPPVRKDILSNNPADPYMQIFYESAIQADTWLDPNSVSTESLFKNMIESVISGRASPDQAVNTARNELDDIIQENVKIK